MSAQRAFAAAVVEKLRGGGFVAYWAGGCVRDQLLGRPPKDYDVATSAHPDAIRDLFGRSRTLSIGAAFGVITVLGPKGAAPIEVATFRQDVDYRDGRHPEAVRFSTPELDAQRRDFTINGLFFDPLEDRVIDFVGGQADLSTGLVRAVGDARQRFAEDKLRLLRAVRFAANLRFDIESSTWDAVCAMADQIGVVSQERIASELNSILIDAYRRRGVELLARSGLLVAILPEIALRGEELEQQAGDREAKDRVAGVGAVTLAALEQLQRPSFALALATLLQERASVAAVGEICRRLRLSTRDARRIAWLVENRDALATARQMPWSRLQRLLVAEGSAELVAMNEALAVARGTDGAELELCRSRLALEAEQLNPPPLLTGDDLIAHGIRPGKEFQQLLEAVRDAQLDKTIITRAEGLQLVDKIRTKG